MDLLEFGMKNQESDSKMKQLMAKAALLSEKVKADLYEKYLDQKGIEIPENPLRDELMLQRIMEMVEEYEKEHGPITAE